MSDELYVVEIDRVVLTAGLGVERTSVLRPALEDAVARELVDSPLPAGRSIRSSVMASAPATDVAHMVARGVADAVGRGRARG